MDSLSVLLEEKAKAGHFPDGEIGLFIPAPGHFDLVVSPLREGQETVFYFNGSCGGPADYPKREAFPHLAEFLRRQNLDNITWSELCLDHLRGQQLQLEHYAVPVFGLQYYYAKFHSQEGQEDQYTFMSQMGHLAQAVYGLEFPPNFFKDSAYPENAYLKNQDPAKGILIQRREGLKYGTIWEKQARAAFQKIRGQFDEDELKAFKEHAPALLEEFPVTRRLAAAILQKSATPAKEKFQWLLENIPEEVTGMFLFLMGEKGVGGRQWKKKLWEKKKKQKKENYASLFLRWEHPATKVSLKSP
ncbi:MAG: hypothetical protein AABX13_05235 [Nanoarchaeota archaeon]